MNITSKSRYALKIMMDLTHYRSLPHVKRVDIAKRQGIPPDYLDQIMVRLRSGKLVESIRGRGGGYRLARSPDTISLWDVFGTVEDSIYPVGCVGGSAHSCDFEAGCVAKSAWEDIFSAIKSPLEKIKLTSIADKWADKHRMCPIGGIRECRGGGSALKSIQDANPANCMNNVMESLGGLQSSVDPETEGVL